ncbi:MAG: IMP cyclohydrolase [Oscillospiraceae bacterium]|jgi:hypothetical protein|nr:IMP cyclohydrolase [Oscillospiraceae bacterium]
MPKKSGNTRAYTFAEFLESYLSTRRYPGRGIILGGGILIYFIMGRSENSRNRVFRRTMDGIRTEAFDPEKLTDPSLVIYNAVRRVPGGFVVSNGSQTDDIREALLRYDADSEASGLFIDAAYGLSFEPDPPLYTPRISGYLDIYSGYELAIARSYAAGGRIGCERPAWSFAGAGAHFISTYDDDGNPPPSFSGDPIHITDIPADCAEAAESVWDALDRANRVSLYALSFDGAVWRDIIINGLE